MPTVRRSLTAARAEARVDRERLRATTEAETARQAADDPDTAPLQEDLPEALERADAWLDWPADALAVHRHGLRKYQAINAAPASLGRAAHVGIQFLADRVTRK